MKFADPIEEGGSVKIYTAYTEAGLYCLSKV